MFDRILVPLDGSTLAERAIPHAELFARIFGSSIILLQVLDPNSFNENPGQVDPLSWQIRKAEADMYLTEIATRIRKNLQQNIFDQNNQQNQASAGTSISVDYAIREGKPAENIINFAQTEAIDLLIISTHGSGGLSRWSISSITQKVINLIYLPVLIVRAYNQPESENARIHYRRILLPIDSSRRAECSLSAGIALVRGELPKGSAAEENVLLHQTNAPPVSSLQTKLLLAAVIKPPELPIPEPYPKKIEQLSEQLMHFNRQAVSNYLDEMKQRLSVECETCMVENTSVSAAIQDLADHEAEIDLVVLCAHGYTGRSTWPYGTVARNYMEHGTKPVLVIQDIHRSQVQTTTSEIFAETSGGR